MAAVKPEVVAVEALREYLLRTLPAKVTSINSERAAFLKSTVAEPFVIASNMVLKLATTAGQFSAITLTSGSRTATQVAADINAVVNIASVDSKLRLKLTSPNAPTSSTPSVVIVGTDSTSANAVFGWDPGGEKVMREAIAAPSNQGIRDGENHTLDLKRGFGIVIGEKRTTEAFPNVRHDERFVLMTCAVYVPIPQGSEESYSEHSESCIRAIREVVLEDRTLDSRVQLAELVSSTIYGPAFRFDTGGASPLLSRAELNVRIRVYERA